MGLSGRKVKQRIPADPRNLSWANDANKFGTSYLQKFGWDPSSGLGASGEGRTRHISVHQKLDMLGIGADHRNSQEGTAWRQSREFENLLRRLNEAAEKGNVAEEVEAMKVDGFVRPATEGETLTEIAEDVDVEVDVALTTKNDKKSKKKREREQMEEGVDAREEYAKERKKHKKSKSTDAKSDKREKKDKKKRKHDARDDDSAEAGGKQEESTVTTSASVTVHKHTKVALLARPLRAHRARHIAAKGLASKSAAAINEILGIPSSSASTATPSAMPSTSSTPYPPASLTPVTTLDAPAVDLKLQDLTTSSKSVMDYFREKLAAKSRPSSSSGTSATGTGTPATASAMDDYHDRPRGGLGLGASRLRLEAHTVVDEAAPDQSVRASMQEVEERDDIKEEPQKNKKKKDKKGKRKGVSDDKAEFMEDVAENESEAEAPVLERKQSKKPKKRKEKEPESLVADSQHPIPGDSEESAVLPADASAGHSAHGDRTKKSKSKREKGKQKDECE